MNKRTSNRRQFLKQSVFTAAMPTIISSTALGKGDTPAPSERVNLGFIGCGNRGSQLLSQTLGIKSAQVVAVSDCFMSHRQKALKIIRDAYTQQGREAGADAKEYADFREILASEDIDGVVIATPDHWHVPISMYAIRAGKDVYVEKPLGVSVDYGFKLRKLVQDKKAILQYGTQQRSDVYFRTVCELVRNGYIGKLESIDVWCDSIGDNEYTRIMPPEQPVPADLDYDRWLGSAPMKPYCDMRVTNLGSWHIYDYALGFIAGWGAHPLDIAQWGNNTDKTGPIHYEGTGTIPTGGLFDTVSFWDVQCKYGDGVKMHFMDKDTAMPIVKKYHEDPHSHGTTFHGSEGWVSVRRGAMHFSDDKLRRVKLKSDEIHLYESKNHLGNYIDCIKTRSTPISTIEAAVQSDLISHLSNAAIRLGREIKWDPELEQIIGDDEAAKFINRKMRSPWSV